MLVGPVRSVPGVLKLDQGRVSFVADRGLVLEADRRDVQDVRFPWYYFHGGLKLKVGDEGYRFSFLKPNAARDVPKHLVADNEAPSTRSRLADAAGTLVADVQVASFARGRRAGKAWKAALAPAR